MSNPDLRPTRTLELLAALQKTAGAFAQQEDTLSRELSARRHTLNRQHREALDKMEARLAKLVEDSNASSEAGRERLTTRYEGRRQRVTRAGTALLRKLPLRARQTKERWMGDLQLKQFQAEKKMEADQKAADATLKAITTQLDDGKERLEKLRQGARRAFAGYLGFLKLLRPKVTPAAPPEPAEESVLEMQKGLDVAEQNLKAFRRKPLPQIFSYLLPVIVFPVLILAAVLIAASGMSGSPVIAAGIGGFLFLLVILYFLGAQQGKSVAPAVVNAILYAEAQPRRRPERRDRAEQARTGASPGRMRRDPRQCR